MTFGLCTMATPYSGYKTACCGEPEAEGEDGILYCPKCNERFPELANEVWNDAIDAVLALMETT